MKTEEYTGIDPAPVQTTKVSEKNPVEIRIPFNGMSAFALGGSAGLNFVFGNVPAIKMLEMLVMSKMSFLPHMVAKTLMVGGEVLVPAIAIYAGLKLLGKFTDISECVVGGAYHTACHTLRGLGVVFKNIGPIIKTVVQIPLGLLCPAYAAHLTSVTQKISFKDSVTWESPGPGIWVASSAIHGLGGFLILSGTVASSDPTNGVSPLVRPVCMFHLPWLALNVLYIVGRIAKEKREAEQKVS